MNHNHRINIICGGKKYRPRIDILVTKSGYFKKLMDWDNTITETSLEVPELDQDIMLDVLKELIGLPTRFTSTIPMYDYITYRNILNFLDVEFVSKPVKLPMKYQPRISDKTCLYMSCKYTRCKHLGAKYTYYPAIYYDLDNNRLPIESLAPFLNQLFGLDNLISKSYYNSLQETILEFHDDRKYVIDNYNKDLGMLICELIYSKLA